jgi:hypothetical protein
VELRAIHIDHRDRPTGGVLDVLDAVSDGLGSRAENE